MSNGYETTLLFCFHVSGYSNCSLLDLGCAKPNYTHVTSPHVVGTEVRCLDFPIGMATTNYIVQVNILT